MACEPNRPGWTPPKSSSGAVQPVPIVDASVNCRVRPGLRVPPSVADSGSATRGVRGCKWRWTARWRVPSPAGGSGAARAGCGFGIARLGVGDPALLVVVPDGVRVADRGPRGLVDTADSCQDAGVQARGHREPGATAADGADRLVVVERRVRAHDHQPCGTGLPGGHRRVGDEPVRTLGRNRRPFAQPGGGDLPAPPTVWTRWPATRSAP